jgi:hypothetical protein
MSDNEAEQAAAGVSFLFAPGQRPDGAAWRQALDVCQARVRLVREDTIQEAAELVLNGLSFDVVGLAPAPAAGAPAILEADGLAGDVAASQLEAVRIQPGHHLSGGSGMLPVVRSLAALAAEMATKLPVRAVFWHPARSLVEPHAFAQATLAWLGGGAFPTPALTPLTVLADGSVASRGLAHFIGQETTLRSRPGETNDQAARLAAEVVDYLVLHGPMTEITEVPIAGEMLCFEPCKRGDQVWVWRKVD